jgi:hypothetical protein
MQHCYQMYFFCFKKNICNFLDVTRTGRSELRLRFRMAQDQDCAALRRWGVFSRGAQALRGEVDALHASRWRSKGDHHGMPCPVAGAVSGARVLWLWRER